MYGSFSLGSYVGVALALGLVVALFFLASPLIAMIIAVILGVPLLLIMSGLRQRSQGEEASDPPLTPEGKPTSPTGSRSGGAPASGEGE